MKYCIYKMRFQIGVHFGENSLDESNSSFSADTLFSALCTEALKDGDSLLDVFYGYSKSGELCFSDALPFVGDEFLLPKPMIRPENWNGENRSDKKQFRKMEYVAASQFNRFMAGNLDPVEELELERKIGQKETRTSASIKGLDETLPYRIGVFSFCESSGLYVIVGYTKEEALDLFNDLFEKLSFAGIGGKRSSGFGRFTVYQGKIPGQMSSMLESDSDAYMSLSVSLPKDDELEKALDGASYLINKRSGFVASDSYSDTYMRKRDLFVFKAGSVFANRFSGDIYDVSDGGRHPVYRYARPMFMGIGTVR